MLSQRPYEASDDPRAWVRQDSREVIMTISHARRIFLDQADLPYLDLVYKMVWYDNQIILKRSPGKETLAGEKRFFLL